MKNRVASLFLVFALLMSLCTFAVARDNPIAVQSGGAERFTDVPASHWAYDYIDKVVGSGLFNGKTPTTFEPSNAMTRSQFVMVMARMEGMSSLEGQYTQTKFPDVTPTRRAAGPIAWASAEEQGYVLGFGDGTFKPDSPITRGQFAALIHRYIVSKRYDNLHVVSPEPARFTDASSVSPAFTADVEYARVHGLLTGYSDGTVRASNPITRAAIAAILARFLDLVNESGYVPLMDGPADGGQSETPPEPVPTDYKDIKLVEKNGEHGTTSIVSVLRDGVQVASDDTQEGDVVTVSHKPDSGYVSSIRVRDSKSKTVKPVTTKDNVSTFKLPKNLPVTITVTYTKESGGGGGGGGGSSGGGGGFSANYYLNVKANVAPTEGGTVYLTQYVPTALPAVELKDTAESVFVSASPNVPGYAVFVPKEGYEFVDATSTTANVTFAAKDYHSVELKKSATSDETVNVTYVDLIGAGTTSIQTALTLNVTGNFKSSGNAQTGEPSWKITASGTGADFQLSTEPLFSMTTPKNELKVEKVVNGTESVVYLAVAAQSDYVFGDAEPQVTNGKCETLNKVSHLYKITKSDFTDGENSTTVTMNLTKSGGNTPGGDDKPEDKALKYTLKVNIIGEGSATLKAGNETKTFTKTETWEISTPTKQSEYASLYPKHAENNDYRLPVYLTGKPLGDSSKNYSYKGKLEGPVTVIADNFDPVKLDDGNDYFVLESDKTVEVTITFDEVVSYGYNLTVIGEGSVTVDFNGKQGPYTGSATEPKSYSSGLIVGAPSSLTINKPRFASGMEAEKPVVNGEERDYDGTIGLDKNQLTDIVVEIHKKDRQVYSFTVTVNKDAQVSDSQVTADVKPVSGKIADSYNGNVEPPTLVSPKSSDTVENGGSKTFYAYEDTVITLLPNTTDTAKVKSITVPGTTDVMSTAGYSFQLTKNNMTATVNFGAFDSYGVLLEAPFTSGTGTSPLRSRSSIYQNDTLFGNVLYSLNNGKDEYSSNPPQYNGIANTFRSTPENLNKVAHEYLNSPVVTPKADSSFAGQGKITGSQYLQDMMAESIESNIGNMVETLVKNEISKLDADSIMSKISGSLKEMQDKYPDAIITADKETSSTSGKSVEAQIKQRVEDYLSKIKVDGSYNYSNLTPTIKVEPTANSDSIPVVTISASVPTNNLPKLDSSVKMDTSALTVYAVATSEPIPSGSVDMSAVTSKLEDADKEVQKAWDDALNSMASSLPMDKVFSKDVFSNIVDGMLPMNTLTSKIKALGNAESTKSAIKSLYTDFVEFHPDDTSKFLTLATKGGTAPVIGTIEDGKLVLTLNFSVILRDQDTPADNGAFEELVDLILAFRNGMSQDIQANSTSNQTSQTVIASMIDGQLNSSRGSSMKATKWGTPKTGTSMTSVEKKELANLFAELLMNSQTTDKMNDIYKKLEQNGYTSVEYSIGTGKRASFAPFIEAYNRASLGGDSLDSLTVGFQVEQKFK